MNATSLMAKDVSAIEEGILYREDMLIYNKLERLGAT